MMHRKLVALVGNLLLPFEGCRQKYLQPWQPTLCRCVDRFVPWFLELLWYFEHIQYILEVKIINTYIWVWVRTHPGEHKKMLVQMFILQTCMAKNHRF